MIMLNLTRCKSSPTPPFWMIALMELRTVDTQHLLGSIHTPGMTAPHTLVMSQIRISNTPAQAAQRYCGNLLRRLTRGSPLSILMARLLCPSIHMLLPSCRHEPSLERASLHQD